MPASLDTGRILVWMKGTFDVPERLLDVLCIFNLRSMPREKPVEYLVESVE